MPRTQELRLGYGIEKVGSVFNILMARMRWTGRHDASVISKIAFKNSDRPQAGKSSGPLPSNQSSARLLGNIKI